MMLDCPIHRPFALLAVGCLSVTVSNQWLSAADVPKWTPHDVVCKTPAASGNPFTGTRTPAGELNNGTEKLTPPMNWGDAPLVLHARAGQRLRARAR
jgi:hypothetical protein